MEWLGNLLDKINKFAGYPPGWEEWRNSLTPENTLEELRKFNQNSRVIEESKKNIPMHEKGHILNAFQSAGYIIHPDNIVKMAEYMNQCDVFRSVAPISWINVGEKMFSRCPADQRPDLLSVLERGPGHMQTMVKGVGLGGAAATQVYYHQISECFSVEVLYDYCEIHFPFKL